MLTPWKKSYNHPRQHIQKQRHYFSSKGSSSQSYGFSSSHIWLWELDIKKAEYRRIDALELWCWKTLESPFDCTEIQGIHPKGNLSWIFIGRTMLKLKLQYFGHLMQAADSFEWTLMLGKIEGRREGVNRGWDGWMASLTQWAWVWVNSGSLWWMGRPGVLQSMGSDRTEPVNWAELRDVPLSLHLFFSVSSPPSQ